MLLVPIYLSSDSLTSDECRKQGLAEGEPILTVPSEYAYDSILSRAPVLMECGVAYELRLLWK